DFYCALYMGSGIYIF
nr:immunoglobulin light chain junction region [Macaca mulatta]MOX14070.1 immunoglobulin light chain junction region [Macaca mulatta]